MPPGNILIRVGADTTEAVRKLSDVHGPLSDVQTRSEKMGASIRKATLPAVAVLGGLAFAAKGAAEAAAEDAAGQAQLAAALARTTGATKAQDTAAEAYISSLSRQTGVADDELRPALAKLASATGDVGKAQAQLKLATDISAASGKSLETVSKALAAADDGRTTSLARLVPGLDAATLKSKDMAAITDALNEKVGGAAAAAADTAAGRYKIMQVQMGELQESIGSALLPVIELLSGAMLRVTDFLAQHTTAVKVAIGVVAGLAGGIVALNGILKVYEAGQIAVKIATALWTGAQWLLNAALDANPIGIVVLAIAGLVAAVVVAYQKSETFRGAVDAVWGVLKQTNPVAVARGAIDLLSGAVQAVAGFFRSFADRVGDALDKVSGLRGAVGLLWQIFGATNPIAVLTRSFELLRDAVSQVVDWIGRIHFPDPPGWLSKLGGAVGGLFGAVAPSGAAPAAGAYLSRSAAGGAPRAAAPRSISGAGGSAGSGVTINVFGATDPEGTARAIKRTLRAHDRRQGTLTRIAPAGAA